VGAEVKREAVAAMVAARKCRRDGSIAYLE